MDNNLQNIKKPVKPLQGKILDVDELIKSQDIKEVISHSIYETNSTTFHPEGLFSEIIFGAVSSEERYIKKGYINLKCNLITPPIYNCIFKLKKNYISIINGTSFAYFDKKEKQFISCSAEDKNAKTGISFFIKHIYDLKFEPSKSLSKQNLIAVFEKYKKAKLLLCNKLIVIPAGLRDIRKEDKVISKEDINNIYLTILSLTQSIPEELSDNELYDPVKINIQKKIYEIYKYIINIEDGKKGNLQNKYAARNVALSTRNVLSAALLDGSDPNDSRYLKFNETYLSLYQVLKMFQPFIIFGLKEMFKFIFTKGSLKAPLINPKTYKIEYIDVNIETIDRFTTNKLENIINMFKYKFFRDSPMTVTSSSGKDYYIILAREFGDIIHLFRDIDDLKMYKDLELFKGHDVLDKKKIRPLTWVEFLYQVVMKVDLEKNHTINTRYPVVEDGSIYPSKIKVLTTVPNRRMYLFLSPKLPIREFPHYPILGNNYFETMAVHPGYLSGLGADHDGDQLSATGIWGNDSNEELSKRLETLDNLISVNLEFKKGNTTNIDRVIYNLSTI